MPVMVGPKRTIEGGCAPEVLSQLAYLEDNIEHWGLLLVNARNRGIQRSLLLSVMLMKELMRSLLDPPLNNRSGPRTQGT